MAIHFVPTEEIQRLTAGSYEHLASKLDAAVSQEAGKVFGESIPNRIERVGTFGDHALFAADDGRFVRVKYGRGPGGSVRITESEAVTVPLFTESNLDTYLIQQARTIVDSLLAHDEAQAESKLRALLPFVQEHAAPSPDLVVATALEAVQGERPWKRIYAQRAEQVQAFLDSALAEIEQRRLPVKFGPLFQDADEEKLESHREVAVDDLAYLSERFAQLADTLDVPASLKEASTLSESDKALVTTFVAFAEDLQRDLRSIRDTIGAVLEHVNSVASLGQVYDTLAESVFDFEVAAQFASAMIAGLQQPE